jgi:hypothetical protein
MRPRPARIRDLSNKQSTEFISNFRPSQKVIKNTLLNGVECRQEEQSLKDSKIAHADKKAKMAHTRESTLVLFGARLPRPRPARTHALVPSAHSTPLPLALPR